MQVSQAATVEPTTPHHAAFAALPPPLAERILYKAFVAGGRSVAAREQLSRVCKTWRKAVARWPVDLVVEAKLSRPQYDFLNSTAPAAVRSIIITDQWMFDDARLKDIPATSAVILQRQSLPASKDSLIKLHGLSIGFVLKMGASTGLNGLDLSRFARLKKLHMSGYDNVRAVQLGWDLVLPQSLRVVHFDNVEDAMFEGAVVKDLTALQELRISGGAAIPGFKVFLNGLPPSLRRLSILHDHKPPYEDFKVLAIAAPAAPPADPGASNTSPARSTVTCQAASSQPPASAVLELLDLVMDCHMVVLPASLPLGASCAVALHTAHLSVTRSLGQSAPVGPDREQVIARLATWAAETGATKVKILRLCPVMGHHNYGKAFVLSTADETLSNLFDVQFDHMSELASVLEAPCSRQGLHCRLEQGADGDAVVICRLP